jgi:hypothetical protein
MNHHHRALLLLAAVSGILFVATRADADGSTFAANPTVAPTANARDAEAADKRGGKFEIRYAVGQLDQAALQWDFSSHAQELDLLQSARARLASWIGKQRSPQLEYAQQLETDIDDVILRASSQIGPLHSATGASYGPPAPSRNQLAQLATEAQNLERETATARRLTDGTRDASIRSSQDPGVQSAGESFDPAQGDALSWPLGTPSTTALFAFNFDVGRASH